MVEHVLAEAVDASIPLAERLFCELRERSADTRGVRRDSYGAGEQAAHDLLADAARDLDLDVHVDYAGNLYMTLAGERHEGHGVITGSHLDSVPQGGNYDGAAGVVAGVTALAAMRRAGIVPRHDVTVMGTRSEESVWFPCQHFGSRAALGLVEPHEVDTVRRTDTGRTLAEHMADLGLDVAAVRAGRHHLTAERVRAYFELHIEQGPVLEHDGIAVGIVTGIRGNCRARQAVCRGAYAHAGAVPRRLRHDAVMAVAEYVHRLDAEWERIEADGGDMVLTVGKFYTDAAAHTHSKIPGEVRFSLDIRSHDVGILDHMTSPSARARPLPRRGDRDPARGRIRSQWCDAHAAGDDGHGASRPSRPWHGCARHHRRRHPERRRP